MSGLKQKTKNTINMDNKAVLRFLDMKNDLFSYYIVEEVV